VDLKEYSDRIRIISMSWGGSGAISMVESALQYAVSKGCIPVAAAGNSGYTGTDSVNYPGKYDGLCITVAAIGQTWKPSYFTSGGPAVDVTAFGENILMCNHLNGYAQASGTSFSTPMVAGLLANVVSHHYADFRNAKEKAVSLAETFLEKYARDLEAAGKDDTTGAGAPVMAEAYFKNRPGGSTPQPDPQPEPPKPDPQPEPPKPEPPQPGKGRIVEFPFKCNVVWRDHTADANSIFSEPAGYTIHAMVSVEIQEKDFNQHTIGMIGNHIDTVGFVYRNCAMYGAADTNFIFRYAFKRAHNIRRPIANLAAIADFLKEEAQNRIIKNMPGKATVTGIQVSTGFESIRL
jgi:hypothetical protein